MPRKISWSGNLSSHPSYVSPETVEQFESVMLEIEQAIYEELGGYENFAGFDFCDVGASGIQLRTFHNQVRGYAFPNKTQPTIAYDFSNWREAVVQLVANWMECDNPEYVDGYNSFLREGEKWGWD